MDRDEGHCSWGTVASAEAKGLPSRLTGELRWAVRDASWDDYIELAERLPASFRVAFDGKQIEMMVTSRDHDQVGWLMANFAEAVIDRIGIKFVPCGRASPGRSSRPSEASRPTSATSWSPQRSRLSKSSGPRNRRKPTKSGYPTPDLAIEVDIS